jgi:cytosine deaminase
VLDVAAANDRAIDLHVDETLDVGRLTLRDLARQVRDRGFTGAVAASHCCSLAVQDEATQEAVAAEVADAGIAVIPLPQTNLYLQGRQHRVSVPRALAPIDVLRRAGVTVAAGGDNVQDPFNPVGRSDPLETASLLVVAGHQFASVAYDMVSNESRAAMGLPRVTMAVGDPADLVAIDAPNTRAAVADAPADRMVFRRGRLVATTTRTTAIHR